MDVVVAQPKLRFLAITNMELVLKTISFPEASITFVVFDALGFCIEINMYLWSGENVIPVGSEPSGVVAKISTCGFN